MRRLLDGPCEGEASDWRILYCIDAENEEVIIQRILHKDDPFFTAADN